MIKQNEPKMEGPTEKIKLPLEGMSCASCAQTIEKSLKNLKGIQKAEVNFAQEMATVSFDPAKIELSHLKKAVEEAGYKVKEEKVRFKIGDMTCNSCAITIENALKKRKGVTFAHVNFATEEALISYIPGIVDTGELTKTIKDTGYRVIEREEEDKAVLEARKAKKRLKIAWAITAPLIVLMILKMIFGIKIPFYLPIEIAMATLVLGLPGLRTLRSGVNAITHGSPNMDVLITMGTSASFLTGILSISGFHIESFAGVGAMIMAFHLTGRYIESSAKGKASQAIRRLLELGAKTAKVLRDGEEREVPIEVRATKVGKDTFLSQVIKLVEECQGSKVPIQEFADRVTAYFVPTVMSIAGLTFLFWLFLPQTFRSIAQWASHFLPWVNPDLGVISLAVFAAVAVLVIACPCALGLATPTALMVGSGLGAQNGIIFRSGEAIQTLKGIKTIVFDKTGTITKGKPEVTDVVAQEGYKREELLSLAASLERGSEHPLASAIVDKAKQERVSLKDSRDFQALSGMGIKGRINRREILVGNEALMKRERIELSKINKELKELQDEAKTVVLVAIDKRIAGLLAIADTLKENSVEAISELKRMGFKIAMITGDNERTARAIAKRVGIDRVLSNVLPSEKQKAIEELQGDGMVAMVGDGINDAPALVVKAIKLSLATFKKIKENLFWAFFYNIVAIPVAILGLLHPLIAEAAMAFSSINVVTNSLRLICLSPYA